MEGFVLRCENSIRIVGLQFEQLFLLGSSKYIKKYVLNGELNQNALCTTDLQKAQEINI